MRRSSWYALPSPSSFIPLSPSIPTPLPTLSLPPSSSLPLPTLFFHSPRPNIELTLPTQADNTLTPATAASVRAAYEAHLAAELAAADGVPFITLLPWVPPAIFAAGVVVALVLRARRPAVYAGLGHFSLTDPELDVPEEAVA